ncbi:MAG: hypothetical protein FJ151_02545 [Euryarchaeota archaeon]|nr:hypothetical protein [Euryarchaeota archaeon]
MKLAMMTKAARGRRRYIAFRLSPGGAVSGEEFASALNKAAAGSFAKPPRMIQFDGSRGIIRCSHFDKERMIDLLNRLRLGEEKGVGVETLMTSGTLKTLRERAFGREERNPGRTG